MQNSRLRMSTEYKLHNLYKEGRSGPYPIRDRYVGFESYEDNIFFILYYLEFFS